MEGDIGLDNDIEAIDDEDGIVTSGVATWTGLIFWFDGKSW